MSFNLNQILVTLTFFLLILLFFIVHINLQQSDEHTEQDTKKLQVGTSFSHLEKDK